ncbi:MAG: Wzz/FepE/Etk N-terminal domain-containing protein [Hyphomicrobiales bacterium]
MTTLGAALWRAKGWILGLVLLAGAVTFIGLSMVRPLYTSEARILIQNEDRRSPGRHQAEGRAEVVSVLDEQAVQSQVRC